MPHEVGKQGDVVELIQEVFGKAVAERVRIYHLAVDAVAIGKVLQLNRDATGGKSVACAVGEQIARRQATLFQPLCGFGT